jgi:hypothetical protein
VVGVEVVEGLDGGLWAAGSRGWVVDAVLGVSTGKQVNPVKVLHETL